MIMSRRQAAAGLLAFAGAGQPLSRAFAQPAAAAPPSVGDAVDEDPTEVGSGHDGYEHMLAPVSINGQGPFQFLMDTGANTSCVSRDLAQRLMLAGAPPARVHTLVGVRERPGVLIESLQVGARSRKAVRAAALPLSSGLDGVLGVDWLAGQRLVLGFKDRNISIARSVADPPRDGSVVVPARRRMGQLTIVDADMGRRRINAMIDSGSQLTICNSALRDMIADENRRSNAPRDEAIKVKLETIAGEAFYGEMVYIPFLRLGGLRLGNVPVVHANTHVFELWELRDKPAIVLGMDLLTQFDTVSLDFGRSQVRFDLSAAQRGLSPATERPV